MSLDITLYTTMPEKQLEVVLSKYISNSHFKSYSDWQKSYPPGRFDNEILTDLGYSITISSTATFRIRKDTMTKEYAFLQGFLENIRKNHEAIMLLNGNEILFNDVE